MATELVSMEIYSLLRKHSINLSILIYPWPGTLIHDNENSKYVELADVKGGIFELNTDQIISHVSDYLGS